MRNHIIRLLTLIALAFGGFAAQATAPTRILIPLYIRPPWASVIAANAYNNIDVIVNPASGVGAAQSASYVTGINSLRAAGVGVFGYVYTSYGARDAATVKDEITKWQNWYGVNGIFLDEASNNVNNLAYYADLYAYIKAKQMQVILNPGANTAEGYINAGDVSCIYESSTAALTPAAWVANYPPQNFCALKYGANVDQMRAFVAEAKAKNIGYIYVTDDILPNPWNTLPAYLNEMAALAAGGIVAPSQIPGTATIPPTVTTSPTVTNTASAPLAGISFAVIGDYGVDNANEAAVAAQVKSWNPDFIITTGDNNYPSGAASTIDTVIGKYYSDYIGNYTGAYGAGSAVNRFFPSLGNHDHVATNAQPAIDYFTLPGKEYYYDFVRGDVHFFALDHYTLGGTSQTGETALWLKAALAASTSKWNVVYFHASPYTSGTGNGSYTPMRWPFAAWGADFVITGHEHSYERLFVDGITYFVNGSGGAGLYAMGSPIAGSQVRYNALNGAMLVTTSGEAINFKFINKNGVVIDDYTAGTGATVTASPVVTPTLTMTATPTRTASPTITPISTLTATISPVPTFISVPTSTVTSVPTKTHTATPAAVPTVCEYSTHYMICTRP